MNDTATSNRRAPFRVLFICGSLRRESFNRKLMNVAIKVAPPNFQFSESVSIGELPHLNEDVFEIPEPVQRMKEQVRAADAIVIATPEYNYSTPGVLKNALDWIPFPAVQPNPMRFKPVGLMGASIGNFGTTRSQLHLRQTLMFHEVYVLPRPEIYIFRAFERFDAEGALTDQAAVDLLIQFWPALEELAEMTAAKRHSAQT